MKSNSDRLRWFAAEFLVVVTGVLVALAIQSVYQYRQQRKLERQYLDQLSAELQQTADAMASADAILASSDRAGVMLVRAYRTNTPHDSIRAWLTSFSAVGRGRPVLGTAEALVNSGDLRLIRDDSLRAAIPPYIARTRNFVEVLVSSEQEFRDQRFNLSGILDVNQAVADLTNERGVEALPRSAGGLGNRYRDTLFTPLPATIVRQPFPIDIDALLASQDAYRALDRMTWASWVHHGVRRLVRERAAEMRLLVEQAR